MTDFPIPPEVVDAMARAIAESLRTARLTPESQDGYKPEALAAARAMLAAWPEAKSEARRWEYNPLVKTHFIILPIPPQEMKP